MSLLRSHMHENSRPTLPAETICHIFSFLTPRDVIRLRTVSKQFHDISYLPQIWQFLYTNACLPRPLGPFPSQSVQFLERTLVKSERLTLSWVTQPVRVTSSMEIRSQDFPLHFPKVIDGRWMIVCEASRTFVVHDMDSDMVSSSPHVLYEHDQPIDEWDASSVISRDGPVIHILFSTATSQCPGLPWKLLEFRVSNTTGQLYHSSSLEVPTRRFVQTCLHGGRGPFLYLRWNHLILDANTRKLYKFPVLGSALDGLSPGWRLESTMDVQTLISKTHVIMMYPVIHGTAPVVRSMLVQAFTLPTDSCSVSGDLPVMRLSHEGIIDGSFQNLSVIRNSLVDPTSGDISIRLLHQSFEEGKNLHFSCIDLVLPRQPPRTQGNPVLPMKIDAYEVLQVKCAFHGACRHWVHSLDASDDGHARGIWQSCPMVWQPISDCQVLRFAIDASQEKCTAVISGRSTLRLSHLDRPHRTTHLWVDCVKGRWWYMNEWIAIMNGEETRRVAYALDIV